MDWHLTTYEKTLAELGADRERGLSFSEAQQRLAKYGRNELVEKGGRTPFQIIWEQLTAVMVLILIAAAVMAALLGDYKNAFAIVAIVGLFTVLGFDPRVSR